MFAASGHVQKPLNLPLYLGNIDPPRRKLERADIRRDDAIKITILHQGRLC